MCSLYGGTDAIAEISSSIDTHDGTAQLLKLFAFLPPEVRKCDIVLLPKHRLRNRKSKECFNTKIKWTAHKKYFLCSRINDQRDTFHRSGIHTFRMLGEFQAAYQTLNNKESE